MNLLLLHRHLLHRFLHARLLGSHLHLHRHNEVVLFYTLYFCRISSRQYIICGRNERTVNRLEWSVHKNTRYSSKTKIVGNETKTSYGNSPLGILYRLMSRGGGEPFAHFSGRFPLLRSNGDQSTYFFTMERTAFNKAWPLAVLPPTGQKPLTPSCLRACFVAAPHLPMIFAPCICYLIRNSCSLVTRTRYFSFGIPIFADTPPATPKIYKAEPRSPGQMAEIDGKY